MESHNIDVVVWNRLVVGAACLRRAVPGALSGFEYRILGLVLTLVSSGLGQKAIRPGIFSKIPNPAAGTLPVNGAFDLDGVTVSHSCGLIN